MAGSSPAKGDKRSNSASSALEPERPGFGQALSRLGGLGEARRDLLLLLPGDKAHRVGPFGLAADGLGGRLAGGDAPLCKPLVRLDVVKGAERILQPFEEVSETPAPCLAFVSGEEAGEKLRGVAQLLGGDAQLVPLADGELVDPRDLLDDLFQAPGQRLRGEIARRSLAPGGVERIAGP